MANRVRKAIGGLFHHQRVKHQLKLLRKSRQNYHKIQGNFNVINDFFSLTAWSVCCAILTIVASVATLLRRWVKEDTETNDEYMEQYIEAQSSLMYIRECRLENSSISTLLQSGDWSDVHLHHPHLPNEGRKGGHDEIDTVGAALLQRYHFHHVPLSS